MEQFRRLSNIDDIILCDVYIFLHFHCYGMRSVMLPINEYDDDDDL